MADPRCISLFESTISAMPPGMKELKPGAVAVAILKPDHRPEGSRTEHDYLWIRCHGKTLAPKLCELVKLKLELSGEPILTHRGIPLNDQTPMTDIVGPRGRLVVLEAFRKPENAPRVPASERQPLKATDHHLATQNIKREPSYFVGKGTTGPDLHELRAHGHQDENKASIHPQFGILAPPDRWRAPISPKANLSPPLMNDIDPSVSADPSSKSANVHTDAGHNVSRSQASEVEDGQTSFQLHTLLKDAEPEVLETSVKKGLRLLEKIKEPLLQINTSQHSDASQWMQQIENLRKQAVPTRTIIGVVGNTGAGKSSVINAMLDEERLVPTNCMRACTAVVTELSYNYEQQPYRAEIEFITVEDWRKELETLFRDLLDLNGAVSRECAHEDSDAGIAYAKIKAVYPKKTKDDIANSSIDNMLQAVSHLLGTKKSIAERDSSLFYTRLQHYVDSKEKITQGDKKEKEKKKKGGREMEYWPLIKVVRIYVKSPALSTGAVIVDLPGVHDSNAARAAVAEGYMKQCTGLWIVAPINRAVDDKAAKVLLGESFKRQLKMDGGFNAVTFICSKTDDISLLEAQDSLDLGDELGALWAEIEEAGQSLKDLKKQREDLKESKMVYSELMNDADDELEIWDRSETCAAAQLPKLQHADFRSTDRLRDEIGDGKTVFAPKAKSSGKKRKAKGSQKPRKRQRVYSNSDSGSSADEDYDDEETSDKSESADDTGDPLTEEQISSKISEIKDNKKKARQERAEVEGKIKTLDLEIKALQAKETKIEADIAAKCIAGRNEYSKGAIRQDFAAGIKELDQEIAAEDDEENFNPDIDVRDYDEVAQSLKCFCVSSRAYQKLSGRLQKDPAVPGFRTIEETEMPQLQTHCKELTKEGRSANCRKFINNLSQLLNSLALWASSDGTGENLSPKQREREAQTLTHNLKKLEDGLDKAVASTCKDLSEEFGDNIFDRYQTAVNSAINEANDTARKWGMPINRDHRELGGVVWSTYKAICRRNGVYTNARGLHEWNAQLAEPMLKVVAAGWEKMFTRRTPMVMASFPRSALAVLKNFHNNVEVRARKIGLGIAGLHALKQQLSVYENILKDISREGTDIVNANQKEINRCFVPIIQSHMNDAYTTCVDERGPGSYARMKAAMLQHVDLQRHNMFQQSVNNVRDLLKKLLRDLEARMNDKTDEVFVSVKRDYRAVLGGGDAPQGQILPKSERLSRKEVLRIIGGIEAQFQRIAAGEPLEDEVQEDAAQSEVSPKLEQDSDQPAKSDAPASSKSQEDRSFHNDSGAANSIQPRAPAGQTMTEDPRSGNEIPVEAALPSADSILKPTGTEQDNPKPIEHSQPLDDGVTKEIVKRETPEALDAQFDRSPVNKLESGSSYGDVDSD